MTGESRRSPRGVKVRTKRCHGYFSVYFDEPTAKEKIRSAPRHHARRPHGRGHRRLQVVARVLSLIASGVARPGAMQRRVPGLTAKVLNERLRKLLRFGIIEREVFAEVPPRVEYRLSTFGRRFSGLLDEIEKLEAER